jgi:peptide/nickel transport system substrate-binding protein
MVLDSKKPAKVIRRENLMDRIRIAQNQVNVLPLEQTTEDADLQTIQMLSSEPLVRWDQGRMLPGLADSWEISDNGRTWHFHLRENAKFADGSSCTVEDVLHTFELLRISSDPFHMPGPLAPYLQRLVEHPVGKYDLKLHSTEPNGDVADILSEVFIRKLDSNGQPTLGTGRYRIVEHQNGEYVRMEAREDAPNVLYKEITFHGFKDPHARYAALKDGRVDLAVNLEQLGGNAESIRFKWGKIGNTLTVPIFLNGFTAPFNQPEARLAINYAVDIHRIIREVWPGLAIPAATVVSPYHYGYPGLLKPLPYNPTMAKELFYKVGAPTELVLRTPLYLPDCAPQVCEMVAQQLGEIGLRVKIDTVQDRFAYANEVGARHIGHMAIFDSTPHSTYRILREKVSSRVKWIWWQGVVDDQADALISAAHECYLPEARKKAYEKVLTYLNEAPVWLYLYHPINVYAYHEGVQGVEMNHAGLLRFLNQETAFQTF